MDGLWHTAGYTLRKFHDTWLTRFPVSSPVFLVFLVFPGGITHSIGSAQCAMPANRTHSHVLGKFRSTWHTLHQVPIVRTSPYKSVQVRIPLPAPCALRNALCQPTEHTALCYRNSKAHGTQVAIDHLQYSRYSQYSWFLCPHPVHCAMCFASLPEARERSESRPHGGKRAAPAELSASGCRGGI